MRSMLQLHHQKVITSIFSTTLFRMHTLWCAEVFGKTYRNDSSIFPQHDAHGVCPQLESRQILWAFAHNTWRLPAHGVGRMTVFCLSYDGPSCCSEACSNWKRRSSCEKTKTDPVEYGVKPNDLRIPRHQRIQ